MKRALLLAVPLFLFAGSEAEAKITADASVGIAYNIGGDTDRSPVTFELGAGYQFAIVRLELNAVLAASENNVYPPVSGGFLGLKPQAKVFIFSGFYGKASAQLFFEGENYGVGLGGGYEFSLADVVGVFSEVTFNPYFEGGAGLPVELRAGATLMF